MLPDTTSNLDTEAALAEVIRRRHGGDELSDEAVIQMYPTLAKVLTARLAKLSSVRAALSARSPATTERSLETSFLPLFISDRYDVHREINHGGQAIVYLAHDKSFARNVAIKVLR